MRPAHGPDFERIVFLDRGVETEQQLLGLLLRGEERGVLPDMLDYTWSDGAHRAIYEAVVRIRAKGKAPHPTAVNAVMPAEAGAYAKMGGLGYLIALQDRAPLVMGPSAEAEHIELLRARQAKLRLIDLGAELSSLAASPETTAQEALGRFWDQFEAIRLGGTGSPRTYRQLALDKVERLRKPPVVHPTGLPAVDAAMQGGMWPGKLYGIAARRKHGKSLFLGTAALNLAEKGVRILYVTLEQGPDEVTDRLVASRLDTNALAFLRRDDPGLPKRVAKYAEDAPECLLFEDRAGLTFSELKVMLGRYVAREKIKVFILDYWQLVQGTERGESEATFLGRVAQWLADAARNHGIAVLTAAQINREGQTLGSDGLRRACSMYLHQHKIESGPETTRPEQLWLEMEDTRYTPRMDIGTEEHPLLYIDRIGPSVRQWGV